MKLKKKYFMIRRIISDLFTRDSFSISEEFHSQLLEMYYFNFSIDPAKLNKLITAFDQDGIPLNTTYIDVGTKKLHYYPISIAQYALAVFNDYIRRKSEKQKAYFLRIANWFINSAIEDDKLGVYWLTDVDKPEYKVFQPWKSAFTQSRAISILLRGWQTTGDEVYLKTATKALIPFNFSPAQGGVSSFSNTDHPFYEEYVAAEPTMVLDGHNFALLGLYDFVRAVPINLDPDAHNTAERLFHNGINSLLYWLPEFDLGFWLRFNLCQMDHYPPIDPCTIGYFHLILTQLNVLYHITRNDKILEYHHKFAEYDGIKNYLKMYMLKYQALKKLNRI